MVSSSNIGRAMGFSIGFVADEIDLPQKLLLMMLEFAHHCSMFGGVFVMDAGLRLICEDLHVTGIIWVSQMKRVAADKIWSACGFGIDKFSGRPNTLAPLSDVHLRYSSSYNRTSTCFDFNILLVLPGARCS